MAISQRARHCEALRQHLAKGLPAIVELSAYSKAGQVSLYWGGDLLYRTSGYGYDKGLAALTYGLINADVLSKACKQGHIGDVFRDAWEQGYVLFESSRANGVKLYRIVPNVDKTQNSYGSVIRDYYADQADYKARILEGEQ